MNLVYEIRREIYLVIGQRIIIALSNSNISQNEKVLSLKKRKNHSEIINVVSKEVFAFLCLDSQVIFDCIHEILCFFNGEINFLFKFHEILVIFFSGVLLEIKGYRNILLINAFHFFFHIVEVFHFVLSGYYRLRRHCLAAPIHTFIALRFLGGSEIGCELALLMRWHVDERTITLREILCFV